MNRKIYAGILAFGVAAAFWACGSGEILDPNPGDGTMSYVPPTENPDEKDVFGINPVTAAECPECFIGQSSSSSSKGKKTRSSSSSQPSSSTGTSSSNPPTYSSSDPFAESSSSTPYSSPASSSNPPQQSSSSQNGGDEGDDDIGTCAPSPTTVELGDKVTWKFSRGSKTPASALLQAAYTWTFEGGTPGESGKVTGASGTTQSVTYATSGDHAASVVFGTTGGAHVIQCSPVHVNGAPITGCKCAPVGITGSVNYLKTPEVAWTVSGCSTGAGLTLAYAWDGGAAGAETSFTKTFDAATASAAPTLTVINNDNSKVDVTCTPVKVTEGEEFSIKSSNDKVVFKESGSFAISANLPEGWHNDATKCNVYCQAQTSNFVVTIDEIELSGKKTGMNYVKEVGLLVAHTVGGYSMPVTVEVAAGDSVTCGVQW